MIDVGWARGTLAELVVSAGLKPQPIPDSLVVLKTACSASGRVVKTPKSKQAEEEAWKSVAYN